MRQSAEQFVAIDLKAVQADADGSECGFGSASSLRQGRPQWEFGLFGTEVRIAGDGASGPQLADVIFLIWQKFYLIVDRRLG